MFWGGTVSIRLIYLQAHSLFTTVTFQQQSHHLAAQCHKPPHLSSPVREHTNRTTSYLTCQSKLLPGIGKQCSPWDPAIGEESTHHEIGSLEKKAFTMTFRRWRRKHSPRDPVVGEESTNHEVLPCSSDDGGSSEEHGVPALLLKLRKGSIPLLVGEPIAKPGCRHRVLRPEGESVSGCGDEEYPYQQYCCRHLEMHCYHVVAFPLQKYFANKRFKNHPQQL